jgi:hypothetical protein
MVTEAESMNTTNPLSLMCVSSFFLIRSVPLGGMRCAKE